MNHVHRPDGEKLAEIQYPTAGAVPTKALARLLQVAYSAERAAAFAYQGHADSVSDPDTAVSLKQIEDDEWHHRACIFAIMNDLDVSPLYRFEVVYFIIGQIIALSCYIIGWFMPMYFAGRLESGNVNEYIALKRLLHAHGTTEYDAVVDQMTQVEKDHELFFLDQIAGHWMLPLFRPFFRWGPGHSFNEWPAHPIEE